MNWTDFLAKVKLLKKDYETGQIDLRAGSLLTLLFAGAFDTVLGRSNCTYLDYLALSDELLHALGSSAALPKAKKGSLIGIANIASELDLHLWRTQMNPTYTFDINALFEAFLLEKDFIKQPSHLEYEYRRRVKESRVEAFIFKNVNLVFDLERYRNYFMQKQSTALVGLMGIVQDYSVRLTKTGREMGTFKMFLGDQVSPIV